MSVGMFGIVMLIFVGNGRDFSSIYVDRSKYSACACIIHKTTVPAHSEAWPTHIYFAIRIAHCIYSQRVD